MSDNALQTFAVGLSSNSTLTDLFFTHNNLQEHDGPGAMQFIQSLSNKSALKSLALNSCNLNGDLLEALKTAIENHS